MKKMSAIFIWLGVMLILTANVCPSFASVSNGRIRVGLYFGSTALSEVGISANSSVISITDMDGNPLNTLTAPGSFSSYTMKLIHEESGKKYIGVYDNFGRLALSYPAEAAVVLYPNDGSIMIHKKSYRGGVSVRMDKNMKLTVINVLPLEEYLYGVVPREMPSSWKEEALKAQAVAARTYTIRNLNKFEKLGFDICTTQNCQVYGGLSAENPRTNRAVDETRGLLMYYQNQPIQAVYHSSSGGSTEDAENVWGESTPYLRGVPDEFSLGSPHDAWEYRTSKQQLSQKLSASGKPVGTIRHISIDKISPNGRVMKMTIVGSDASVVYEKESIRKLLGYSNIKSSYFNINGYTSGSVSPEVNTDYSIGSIASDLSYVLANPNQNYSAKAQSTSVVISSEELIFHGKGYGHSLGMSQYGAKTMAEQGYNYAEILKYYFTGIDIY